uniref:CSON014690 protein n=1 Tax=Culicoides sonorensis TaxID=179676 RepID=A0A336L264_CULSO
MRKSIQKSLESDAKPIKFKHIRTIIIGTFQIKDSGQAFWTIVTRQPFHEQQITSYKFCYLTHKVLREGHPNVIQHSMRYKHEILELGRLRGQLNQDYGPCIERYTKFIVTKLIFHQRNPDISGDLTSKIGRSQKLRDDNFFFDFVSQMFDYLDDIIALQRISKHFYFHDSLTIFPSIVRLSTPLGHVRMMFKLHKNLSADQLHGHRIRFETIFKELRKFYGSSKVFECCQNLITVPELPKNAPNFMIESDHGNYIPPGIVMLMLR